MTMESLTFGCLSHQLLINENICVGHNSGDFSKEKKKKKKDGDDEKMACWVCFRKKTMWKGTSLII